MAKKNPAIDAYIDRAAPFARPILKHLRKVVHAGCPAVEETLKWSMPHFGYKGLFIGMAAFQQHCSFGFWREAALALGPNAGDGDGMGQFGRITALSDLPSEETLIDYVRRAVELKDAGVKLPQPTVAKKTPKVLPMPDYLAAALEKNMAARKHWDALTPSHRREYIEWLNEAKRDATREKRLTTTLSNLAEGKSLHWKYQ